ncbi:hypothetical protein [Caulobacter sp. CCH9-E1]|jgi:hypothetical protein|uniref:hypothetical protein n=1 Tax=Caulobacter sp. CCH9-E1 TaxID=1768768 RepID=UPI000830FD9B|nr:hypothetical protein [Caulobacter sp. CCH9-E1]
MSIMGLTAGQSIASLSRKGGAPTASPSPADPIPLPKTASLQSPTSLFGADTANGFSLTLLGPPGGSLDPTLKTLLNGQLEQLGAVDTDAGANELAPDGAPAAGRFRTLDTFHMDLGGGQSLEIHHGPAGQGEYNPAAMRAMIAALEAMRHALGDSIA